MTKPLTDTATTCSDCVTECDGRLGCPYLDSGSTAVRTGRDAASADRGYEPGSALDEFYQKVTRQGKDQVDWFRRAHDFYLRAEFLNSEDEAIRAERNALKAEIAELRKAVSPTDQRPPIVSKSEMKRIATLDPQRAAEELGRLQNERDELKGALKLATDDYVKQVGTWKIIQRLEEERDAYRDALEKIAEKMSYPSMRQRMAQQVLAQYDTTGVKK